MRLHFIRGVTNQMIEDASCDACGEMEFWIDGVSEIGLLRTTCTTCHSSVTFFVKGIPELIGLDNSRCREDDEDGM